MSLLSQTDHLMVIEALEQYIHGMKKLNCNQAAINNYSTLLN